MTPKRVEWRIKKDYSNGPEYATEILVYGGEVGHVVVDDTSHEDGKPCIFASRAMARHAAKIAGKGWYPVKVNIYRVKVTKHRERVAAEPNSEGVEK